MNMTLRIDAIRTRIHKLPQWWKDKEATSRVNRLTGALNDLDHADAYSKSSLMVEDAEARLQSALSYVEFVEDKIEDWASDVEVY